jgi:phosphoenolpyruvate-protein phosphotransferase
MIEIASPLAGWATPLDDVPDPVFAERMLGDGAAVDPLEGRVVAPDAGVVSSIHSVGHAVTLALDSGPVLLIHIGLDTVALGGEGFRPAVADGQRVCKGETLIEFDLDLLARRARSLATPVILTNGEAFRVVSSGRRGPVAEGGMLFACEPVANSERREAPAEHSVSRTIRLLLAHGLHARPAARLSKLAGEFDADVEIATPDDRSASARSPVSILGLGLGHGAETIVRASGAQAEQAVAALVELLDSGMGELQPLPEHASRPSAASESPGELRGIAAVAGMAIGPAWRLKQHEVAVREKGGDPAQEREALRAARGRLESALETEAKLDHGGAIAEAHLAMIGDPVLVESAERMVADGKSAAFAWRAAIQRLASPLRASKDPRFAERVDDLADLERRLLAELDGQAQAPLSPPQGAIVIADTLYPSQLKALADSGVAGIATEAGGATSHAAIIAAGLGLPMLVGLGDGLAAIEDGAPLILRGDRLEIATDPSVLDQARDDLRKRRDRLTAASARAQEPAITRDGRRIEVFANLGSVAEAALAIGQGAEGCGLLRTEFLFLDRDAPPDEAEQRGAYQQIADGLGERPLIVRTLDIGADKPAPWLPLVKEDNPALGLRGIRLQLAQIDLLEVQFRALIGVRAADLRIMLPMITGIAELRQARQVLDRIAGEMKVTAPPLGIMVETPAAALLSPTLAKEAVFFSIGTNDLSQYALARDRTNRAVAGGLDPLDPAVLRLIDETARGASQHGRMTGVCGGLAAIPEAVAILVGLGVTELSVPPGVIAEIKAVVRDLDVQRCRALAAQALAAPDAEAVKALVGSFLEDVA